jgi:hypothetical protein
MNRFLSLAILGLASLGFSTRPASAWWFHDCCCDHCCQVKLCCRQYNAFSPFCCDMGTGCFPFNQANGSCGMDCGSATCFPGSNGCLGSLPATSETPGQATVTGPTAPSTGTPTYTGPIMPPNSNTPAMPMPSSAVQGWPTFAPGMMYQGGAPSYYPGFTGFVPANPLGR